MLGATETTSGPDVAPDAIVNVIDVSFHRFTVMGASFKRTALFPCAVPKPLPEIMIWLPTEPVVLERLVIVGEEDGDAADVTETLSKTAVPVVEKSPM